MGCDGAVTDNKNLAVRHEELFFTQKLKPLTSPDHIASQAYLADLQLISQQENCLALQEFLADEMQNESSFLGAVLCCSPFIRASVERHPQILERLFTQPLAVALNNIINEINNLNSDGKLSEAALMAQLRRLKLVAHILIALADLSKLFDSAMCVVQLSRLAEACLRTTVRFLLLDADAKGHIALVDRNNPEKDSGWIILGMGKFGANELNYSSDIDLIVFIDTARPAITDPYECVDVFSKLTRRLVRILQDRTEDGYVFRVDLRLRPDPGATPLAIPVSAALHYYEGRGQNWERAAMIKARPVAGDIISGQAFLSELSPYIWRKYLDYAAIADIHSIKRQIHAHRGHGDIAVRGHNVKLGRGGIREIEFFVQTQQLIAGGRFPQLRGAQTLTMLDALAERGWISADTSADLQKSYNFLRDIEHRIQMVADEQTHILPEDDEGFDRIVYMMGYTDQGLFTQDFIKQLQLVESHYAALFEQAPELGDGKGNLVFTGEEDDPDTLETLSELGFSRPSDICRIIRTWHFGRYRATQTAEARERLTELTPALLKAFAATGQADAALLRFDAFLQGLPSGIQLFSLLQTKPALLDLLVLIMSSAPRLAEIITRKPHIFDGMLDPAVFSELPTRTYLEERIESFLLHSTDYEETLDRLRIFAAEQRFLIGIRLLTGAISGIRAGQAFSDLADLMVKHVLKAVIKEFSGKHGVVSGGRIGIVAMGKLGSRELTAGSDIDIILLYDHEKDAEVSNGVKPLAASHYYIRLTQRLIAALSAPTAEGVLYEVDMRLRPSGNKGPIATHIDSFAKYQRQDAWTWEHMALTRARVVAGDADFSKHITNEITDILNEWYHSGKSPSELAHDIRKMRKLIMQEKPPLDDWDFKLRDGGLIDLEFIAQFAVLTCQVDSAGRQTGTRINLAHLRSGFVDPAVADQLVNAHDFYTNLSQIIRLCLTDNVRREEFLAALLDLLCRGVELPDIKQVDHQLKLHAEQVSQAYGRLFGVDAD